MKNIKNLFFILMMIFSVSVFAEQKIINVFNWADYLPSSVISQFEKETGIHVNITEYSSNEVLFAKMRANQRSLYDVIVPSSYYVERMKKLGMLHKLDLKQLPNIKYIDPNLLNRDFDLKNFYSVPYLWGTTGIVINSKYYNPVHFKKWADLWNPELKNELLLLNDMRQVFAMAMITLGYSVNDTNPEHIRQAYEKLRTLLPNVKVFNSDEAEILFADEDIRSGSCWNGDIFRILPQNDALRYVFPEEGFVIWMDCLSIPKTAPHLENAYIFINFIMRPDIAMQITLATKNSTPNTAAFKMLPKSIQKNQMAYPPKSILKRGIFQRDIGDASLVYEHYWELLKID
jgi:spermidine/putrescine transport system substrate-binding protein